MSGNWDISSMVFAEININSLHGNYGLGFYRLIAQINITTHSRQEGEEVIVTNIGGQVWVTGKNGQEFYLGYLGSYGSESSIRTYHYTNKSMINLEMELDARRLEAIERIRLGHSLRFRVQLHGMAKKSPKNDSGAANGESHTVHASLEYRANQGTWVEILEQMGYRKIMLLEVPVPGDEISKKFPEAAEHLKVAQTHMLSGHFRDAVGACRDVVESLSIGLKDQHSEIPEAIKSWFENSKSMTKEERLKILRRSLKLVTHPARHADEVSARIEWGPEDARAAIIIAATLIQLAVEE